MPLSPRLAAPALLLLSASACQTEVFGGKDTYSPPVHQRDWAQEKIDAGPRRGDVYGPNQKDPAAEPVAELAGALLAVEPRPRAVLCLPLVSQDLVRGKPWVSRLGVATVDALARELTNRGFAGEVLTTTDAGLRIDRANLSRASLVSLEGVAAHGERLGADLVVSGKIERQDRVGALDRDVLSIEVWAYDVAGRRVARRVAFEVPSDDVGYRRAWDLAQAESPWMPDSSWGVPQRSPALAQELERAADEIAARIASSVDAAAMEGGFHVAPLDVGTFAPEMAALRSAQAAYAAEVARREAAGAALTGRIVLNGTEFPDFQAAEAYLLQLAEHFQAAPSARFAAAFSSTLADALRARVRGAGRAVSDLAAVRPADRVLVASELAQGGLAQSSTAREALRAAGVGLVVAPRLERVGDSISIRADAYDLARGGNAASGRHALPANLYAELERALSAGPRPTPPPSASGKPSGSAATESAWTGVYDRVKSGVVHVTGTEGRGSGFVVDARGLVVTNEHVARGIGGDLKVVCQDGAPLPARVVATDPHWDLALLAVDGLPRDAHVFQFAADVGVGVEVAVLGHPRDSSGWVLTRGYVSSTTERIEGADGSARNALMYTSPTRQGSSGSPVLLADGRVAAVHSAGAVGQSLTDSGEKTELTGFALGVPAREAQRFVASAPRP